jgi:hypothetical protein
LLAKNLNTKALMRLVFFSPKALPKRIPERRVTGRGFIAFVESENDTYSQILSRI